MQISPIQSSTGLDEQLPKSSKAYVLAQQSAENVLLRLQAAIVPAQVASLNAAVAPNGMVMSSLLDAVAMAGVISTIGQTLPTDYAAAPNALTQEAPAPHSLSAVAKTVSSVLPISSLSDVVIGQLAQHESAAVSSFNLAQQISMTQSAAKETQLIDLSTLPLGAPVAIASPSNAQPSITVIDGIAGTVRVADFRPVASANEVFLNPNLSTLNLGASAQALAPLSLGNKVEFTVTGIELSTGITVSGTADPANVTLLVSADLATAARSTGAVSLSAIGNEISPANLSALELLLASELTPLFLAELGSVPASDVQVRLTGVVSFTDAEIPPGTLILGG
jgi:hypothetical protein